MVLIVWGREPVTYPPLFSTDPVMILGVRAQRLNLWIMGLGLSVMAALQYFFKRTLTGVSWRAASLDPVTAALYGVNRQPQRGADLRDQRGAGRGRRGADRAAVLCVPSIWGIRS